MDLFPFTMEDQDGYVVEYEYDENGNNVKIIYPSGKELIMNYTSRNELEEGIFDSDLINHLVDHG